MMPKSVDNFLFSLPLSWEGNHILISRSGFQLQNIPHCTFVLENTKESSPGKLAERLLSPSLACSIYLFDQSGNFLIPTPIFCIEEINRRSKKAAIILQYQQCRSASAISSIPNYSSASQSQAPRSPPKPSSSLGPTPELAKKPLSTSLLSAPAK